mgnify:CR=1 FL=1
MPPRPVRRAPPSPPRHPAAPVAAPRAAALLAAALLVAVRPLGGARAQPPSHGSTPAPTAARIAAEPRLELAAIVFRLGGAREFANTQYAPYDSALRAHFAPFAEHEAVALARDLHDRRGITFSRVMSLAIALDSLPTLALRVAPDSVFPGRVPGAEIARFAAALGRFARDARADAFFAAQRGRLDSAAARLARPVQEADAFGWLARFFGTGADRTFVVAPLLANSQGNFGVCVTPDGGGAGGTDVAGGTDRPGPRALECWQILGHQRTDAAGHVTWGEQTIETLVHEIAHGYANPLGDAHGAALDPVVERVRQAYAAPLAAQAYTSARSVLNESLVRATVARFFAERGTPARLAEYLADQQGLGWRWLPELSERLAEYERARAADPTRYPTLAAFMPRVVAYYDSLPPRLAALERRYDAGRPHVVWTSLPAPAGGDTVVLPASVREIAVRFDRPVRPHRFAVVPPFVDGRPTSARVPPPPVTGVTLDAAGTTARLAVALEPGRTYAFQLNTPHGFGFRTADGVPLAPYPVRLRVAP